MTSSRKIKKFIDRKIEESKNRFDKNENKENKKEEEND